MNNLLPRLPFADWIDDGVDWLVDTFGTVFDGISAFLKGTVEGAVTLMDLVPSILLAVIFAVIAYFLSTRGIALFTLIGLLFIDYLGYWYPMLQMLALVLTSVAIALLIGIPLGIWGSQQATVKKIINPILDLMQTMPAFVYLLPAIFFFNIGVVPGVVASVIFSMPPTIRLTMLGIEQVPKDLIEATEAFGSKTSQRLLKVQIPLAKSTIMAGVNQSIMLSLSMVVIASMVGAPGLGEEVYRSVTQLKTGKGFETGLSIVIVAIILDRITQHAGNRKNKKVAK
ncbi:proline/glycine betaine ABC transporter permease [Mammaliicoccus sciuri]|uniref:Glycine betaine/proline transport system permease protein n=2 Tax=Sporosarcina newyorkensis TaxID=759851 RepID=A0A1T4XZH0_9BACL|nr:MULTISPECIES: proline/glycine betaine ABC transporter permease [Sporosarcina]EGQ26871.1 glycine betaine ABC superfamily ATP binding cassette transporter, membrane protein [Sporosarcina newyorkensis 2681]MBY0221545.1 proline/glycine betaine ABC transporter permease [Sporosarcina aquimarina]SKA94939.1 glycine betaine/proline transport system permease protein [Sporosarcina newyorkensis]